ncbi:MAG: hypothetical protein ABUL72_00315, partial [Armatimonadota bacterium]
MSHASKYVLAFAAAFVLVGAGAGGYVARGMVEVGRWPLLAQRDRKAEPMLGGTEALQGSGVVPPSQPVSTDPYFKKGSEADYFYTVADMIQQEYVEPVTITDKMAEGAVKGMIGALSDPDSRFFDADTYPAFHARERGEIHG